MDPIATEYVHTVLELGEHDPGYVDAYYGPPAWRERAAARRASLDEIRGRAGALADRLDEILAGAAEGDRRRRATFLRGQLGALVARVDLLSGETMTFDEESLSLYDAVAPRLDETSFGPVLAELSLLLPGEEPLAARYESFLESFVVPEDRLGPVFEAAIDECRRRTLQHVPLPSEERFELEYVVDKPWSAYNWYRGGFESLIQLNVELPIQVDRAIDLACHEGYPGHHAFNVLLERHLVRDKGWIEFAVYPLFSPQSLIAEGSANYGIEVAFPGEERLRFERDRLFPLAGLDPGEAERYRRVQRLAGTLGYAGNEAARRYLDGELDAEAAARWLESHALMPRERAAQRVRFFDAYRSYVINYNLGEDLVRSWIEGRGGTEESPERRWELFLDLLTRPRMPSELAAAADPGRVKSR
ncbi:MAG: hypothetical protein OEQ13_08255 [Acidobacteriota bacterium]|nr:hypothetical protein [Acidobacteriota bacterium]